MVVLDACSELIHSFSPSPECCLDKSQKKMGVLSFFAKRQEILSSNGFLSVERSFLYTHPNTRDPSQVQSKRPFAYEKGILWPFRWQQNSLAPVEICRLAPIQPEVITCIISSIDYSVIDSVFGSVIDSAVSSQLSVAVRSCRQPWRILTNLYLDESLS